MSAWITGVGLTAFGVHPGFTALDWQAATARAALDDAGLAAADLDGILAGYATTMPHLMPANIVAERLGAEPEISMGASIGGATGLAMIRQATALISGGARHVLVTAGENRASGMSTSRAMSVLSDIGHPDLEAPLGMTIPAYYALLASWYLTNRALDPGALAPLAVQARTHASRHPGAHKRNLIDEKDVQSSRLISDPLRVLECCPISDGSVSVVLSAEPLSERSVKIAAVAGANRRQHLSELPLDDTGAGRSVRTALVRAGIGVADLGLAGIYDSFTITLALILEEAGIVDHGDSGDAARRGDFELDGRLPLNTHGGLLSYGHSGVAGGLAHLAESVVQLRREAGERQAVIRTPWALLHGDGGVMSAHTSIVLEHNATPTGISQALVEPVAAFPSMTEVLRCLACDQRWRLAHDRCPACGSEQLESVPLEREGTVVATTTIRRGLSRDDPPRSVGLIEGTHGVRVLAEMDEGIRPHEHVGIELLDGILRAERA